MSDKYSDGRGLLLGFASTVCFAVANSARTKRSFLATPARPRSFRLCNCMNSAEAGKNHHVLRADSRKPHSFKNQESAQLQWQVQGTQNSRQFIRYQCKCSQ